GLFKYFSFNKEFFIISSLVLIIFTVCSFFFKNKWAVLVVFAFLGFNLLGFELFKEKLNLEALNTFENKGLLYFEAVISGNVKYSEGEECVLVNVRKIVTQEGEDVSNLSINALLDLSYSRDEIGSRYKISFVGKFKKIRDYFYKIENVVLYNKLNSAPLNSWFLQLINGSKSYILKTIDKNKGVYGDFGSSVFKAIFLGDKSFLSRNIKNSFINSGTYHVFAISGQHIVFLYLVLLFILRFFCLPLRVINVLAVLSLCFYCILTGLSPSVVRAGLMIILYIIGSSFGRKKDLMNLLAIAALIILLVKPMYLFNMGFQLSFMAVFAILFCLPYTKKIHEKIKNYVLIYVFDILFISVSIFIFTAGVVSYNFGNITPFSPIANLFILPAVSLLLLLCVLYILVGFLPIISVFVAKLIFININYMIFVVEKMEGFKSFKYSLPLWGMVVYYLVLGTVMFWVKFSSCNSQQGNI
ncbi:ComEC/Rec2 family competence protein, partial [bacterium]|nr:ComEC/Rec2 family competence protein [bacterium]